ncbi:hypothetical protein HON01_02345 [Candidatus Woesearchaeota archaeon]|jgi:hypothetical protein|nr:hypothetical protein [Candidatus Woesearchaeota archaeon]MBT7367912.1 hypothetical protein [Candidatus Woesearchaeota archaeon]
MKTCKCDETLNELVTIFDQKNKEYYNHAFDDVQRGIQIACETYDILTEYFKDFEVSSCTCLNNTHKIKFIRAYVNGYSKRINNPHNELDVNNLKFISFSKIGEILGYTIA